MPSIIELALPVPLRKTFDYLLPEELADKAVVNGRVQVSFGRQQLVGVVLAIKSDSDYPLEKLKAISAVLDDKPVFEAHIMKLLRWAAVYYQHSIGDVLQQALPVLLRQGKAAELPGIDFIKLSKEGRSIEPNDLNRAKRQLEVMSYLQQHKEMPVAELLAHLGINKQPLLGLEKKSLITIEEHPQPIATSWQRANVQPGEKPLLSTDQAVAVSAVDNCQGFGCFLLEGVTGSGKTEVYLQALERVLAEGKQALVIVPEIGLTPQTISRFQQRFDVPIEVLHSRMTDNERLNGWLQAKQGGAAIVIGTRSAMFTPLQRPGIIIIDEEHDSSLKQQEGFRYHARDLAVMRAREENIPLVLGTATPSLETLHNALQGKYHHLHLHARAGGAANLQYHILDMKHQPIEQGISQPLKTLMAQHLSEGNQVLLFLNRRGFAPVVMCHDCGWVAECQRCDISYTVHKSTHSLQCHHCGGIRRMPQQCPECGCSNIIDMGLGTEKLQQQVEQDFADYSTVRIDSDNTQRKGQLEKYLDEIHAGKHQILIGTQMLAKGHHFPDVTLVAILDVDAALYSQDFRAQERFAQMYTQVSGRAGRASKQGYVALQTHHPEHELLQDLVNNGYGHFARYTLLERKEALLPPFSYQALFRSEAPNADKARTFLQKAKETLEQWDINVGLMGPYAAPMEKRAGKYRFQLLLQSTNRGQLQQLLYNAMPAIEALKSASGVRWSLDVNPVDMF